MAETGLTSNLQSGDNRDWRKNLISQLRDRNIQQTTCFEDLINLHNRLFDRENTLRGENLQLSVANEKLRSEINCGGNSGTVGSSATTALEARLLAQAEELTTLHRRRGEHAQQLVDLNNKLQETMKELQNKDISLGESLDLNTRLRSDLSRYENKEHELESANQMLRDEYQALQLAFAALEDKLRKAQEENRQLVERLIKYKAKDADKMNEENDNFLKKRQAKVQKDLEDAARDTRTVSPDRTSLKEGILGLPTAVPSTVSVKFNAHDGEVSAVKWSPIDRVLATGGADRKVKLWDITKGAFESKGMLVGSNASVMSVDFDSTGTLILGASNDFASRVWSVSDLRLRINSQMQEATLNLVKKNLRAIQTGLLCNIKNIASVHISENKFLNTEFFHSLPFSTVEIFSKNGRIKDISLHLFDFNRLARIDLEGNQIKKLSSGSISHVRHLRELYINHNQIKVIEPGFFTNLGMLTHLYLQNNRIVHLSNNVFSKLTNIEVIRLSANQLEVVTTDIFHTVPQKLKHFDVRFNPLKRGYEKIKIFGVTLPEIRRTDQIHFITVFIPPRSSGRIGILW